MTILEFIKDNWLIIVPIVYEILARVIPTKWNISIIDYVIGILNAILENKRIPQPEDVPAPLESGANRRAVGAVKDTRLVEVKSTRWIIK